MVLMAMLRPARAPKPVISRDVGGVQGGDERLDERRAVAVAGQVRFADKPVNAVGALRLRAEGRRVEVVALTGV